PSNPKWLREAVSGHHNLAALELRRGELGAARAGFLGERAAHEKLEAMLPADAELQASIAGVDSYLGSIAERAGDLAEAVARFGLQVARLEAQVKADPLSARMKQRLGSALGLQSEVMSVAGQLPGALERRRQSLELFETLAAKDGANREWQAAALNARLKLAVLLRAGGESVAADRLVQASWPFAENLARAAASNRGIALSLATAWRLEAQRRAASGETDTAEAAARALAAGKSLVELDRTDENHLHAYATAGLLAGAVALHTGDTGGARRHWQAALEVMEPRLRASTHWRVLDPVARLLNVLGRADEGRALVDQLRRFGYQPLEPWP
ncbi:MAG: Serine/threonine-protein kinase PknB, partial [Verrucomicrobiota bacterium]